MPDDIQIQRDQVDAGDINNPQADIDQTNRQGAASKLARERLFDQELNEVALLIDFVSGRSDRSLSALTISDPDNNTKALSAAEIVKRIGTMRYPTPPDEEVANARNAAILLLVKDQLSYLAKPVRGSTIAYTAMFVDAEAVYIPAFLRNLPDRCKRFLGLPSARSATAPVDSRIDLATKTFPGFREHAYRFAAWRSRLGLFTVIWFCITLLAYLDAGLGRSALERLDQDWKLQVASVEKNPLLLHCADTGSLERSANQNGAGWSKALIGNDKPTPLEIGKATLDCRQYNYIRWLSWSAGREVERVFQCDNLHWLFGHVWCWRLLLPGTFVLTEQQIKNQDPQGPKAADDQVAVADYLKFNATYWQTATLVLTVFTTFILPMMFALLGALISGFRSIVRLVGDNELSPRDYVRMQLGIPIGLVAGVAVALFLNPSSVPIQGAGGISGQLTLTASGLGFLAGYAAERFFRFIDNISNMAMPDRIASPSNSGDLARPQVSTTAQPANPAPHGANPAGG